MKIQNSALKCYENYEIYKRKIAKFHLASQEKCKKMTGGDEKRGKRAGEKGKGY